MLTNVNITSTFYFSSGTILQNWVRILLKLCLKNSCRNLKYLRIYFLQVIRIFLKVGLCVVIFFFLFSSHMYFLELFDSTFFIYCKIYTWNFRNVTASGSCINQSLLSLFLSCYVVFHRLCSCHVVFLRLFQLLCCFSQDDNKFISQQGLAKQNAVAY